MRKLSRRSMLFAAPLLTALSAGAQEPGWQPLVADLLAREKPGFGGLSGIAVDRSNGHLYIAVSDRGVFRSTDQGKSWERHGREPFKGRTETPGCMQLDPTGRSSRILLPMVYGGPISLGRKESPDWRLLDPKVTHVDWCAVDWNGDALKLILTLKHESGGALLVSRDGGGSFEEVGKGFGPAWVFDGETAVAAAVKGQQQRAEGGILRTSDAGRTFQPVSEYNPVCLPRWRERTLYWLVQGALIQSADRGATWSKVCDLPNGQYGPVFGKTGREMFVLTRAGIVATADGGASWSAPIPVPPWQGGISQLTWIDFDPVNNALYAMRMGSNLYRLSPPPIRK